MNATDNPRRQWLWDHIGRLSGAVLGLLALAGLIFLAAIGFKPALGLIAVVVIGVLLIVVGGKMHGS